MNGGCPAGWGRKFPVGDPLTPGGGPGRAELRLEEEEGFKKEEAEVREVAKSEEVSGTPSPQQGWELFGHLLVEDTSRPGRYSILKCVRCGTEVSLLDLKTLREKPCVEDREKDEAKQKKAIVSLTRECENCGREATASLCDSCAVSFEKYAEAARPIPPGPPGREWRGIKPPSVPGVDGWAWVPFLTTFFPFRKLEGGGREWWCPACKKTFKRLIDTVDHFRESHPTLASRGWYEEFDAHSRRVRIRTWQGWVDEQQLQLILESEVKPQ